MENTKWEQARRYSHIGMSSDNNFVYAMQYYTSFEIMYDSNAPVDTIALPLLYAMRHYLELILKYNIEYFYEFSGSKNMVGKSVHTLSSLANAFKEHWQLAKQRFNIKIDDTNLLSGFSKLIVELSKMDDYAVSFRYSHNRNKDKNFSWLDTVNIYELKILLDDARLLLNHSTDIFNDETGLMDGRVTKQQLLQQIATQ
ncbi:hypothetical protein [Psychrobacter sp.]|uniref:hypothetical protein n=1 Tax=Psychrobacter sp. TaxID=56811 RepID=UPI003BAEC553